MHDDLIPERDRTQPRKAGWPVLAAGLATSAGALVLVELCNRGGFDPMGFYINWIIPAGALIVGIVAGLGYSLSAWLRQARVRKPLLAGIGIIQLGVYTAALYLTYLAVLREIAPDEMDFTTWFRLTCESMTFSDSKSTGAPTPLGLWGYLFKALELGGFCLGSLIPLFMLRAKPYCDPCQHYMAQVGQRRLLAGHPAAQPSRRKAEERAAWQAEADRAAERADAFVVAVQKDLASADPTPALTRIEDLPPSPKTKVPAKHYLFILHRCKTCDNAQVSASVMTAGGKKAAHLFTWCRHADDDDG